MFEFLGLLAQVSPNRRPTTPCPPPSVNPLIPTVAQVPTGITSPTAARPARTSITFAPAPIVTVPLSVDGRIVAISETSITIPSESE